MDALLRGLGRRQGTIDGGGDRRLSENVWRAILKTSKFGDLAVEWNNADPTSIQRAKERVVSLVLSLTASEDRIESCRQDIEDKENCMAESSSDSLDVILPHVVHIDLERLQTNEKLRSDCFPLPLNLLSNLRSVKFLSEEMIDESMLEAFSRVCLDVLDLSGQRLKQMAVDDVLVQGFKNLTSVRLRRNNLTQLPVNAICNLPLLTELDVSENRLTEAPSNLLQLLPRLEILNLESNKYSHFVLSNGSDALPAISPSGDQQPRVPANPRSLVLPG
eukprot:196539-Hanusia_phi.AAC.2